MQSPWPLQRGFPQQGAIAERLAKGLSSAIVDYGKLQLEKVEAVLGELRELLRGWPGLKKKPPFGKL